MSKQMDIFDTPHTPPQGTPAPNKKGSPDIKRVRYTSVQAYKEAVLSGQVKRQVDKVFLAYVEHGEQCGLQTSRFTGIPEYLIPDRRKELVDSGFVVYTGDKPDPINGKLSRFYKIKED